MGSLGPYVGLLGALFGSTGADLDAHELFLVSWGLLGFPLGGSARKSMRKVSTKRPPDVEKSCKHQWFFIDFQFVCFSFTVPPGGSKLLSFWSLGLPLAPFGVSLGSLGRLLGSS